MQPSKQTLTIENTGQVAALWRFVPKPEEKVFGAVSRVEFLHAHCCSPH
jgi:hypothetical protein